MPRRVRNPETRWRALRRDARVLTVMLELAAVKINELARQIDPNSNYDAPHTPSQLRDFTSECARILHKCGVEANKPAGRR